MAPVSPTDVCPRRNQTSHLGHDPWSVGYFGLCGLTETVRTEYRRSLHRYYQAVNLLPYRSRFTVTSKFIDICTQLCVSEMEPTSRVSQPERVAMFEIF